MSIIKRIDDITYSVNGKEIWYHTVKKVWFCWDCGRFDCEHVKEIEAIQLELSKQDELK